MFRVTLKDGKSYNCTSGSTIFEGARQSGIFLEHSCLSARCRSCVIKIKQGEVVDKIDDLVLSLAEKKSGFALSCNSIPVTDIFLDVEENAHIKIPEKRILPSKVSSKNKISDDVVEISLRVPPNSNFLYNSGQYVNISRGEVKRSYSIANSCKINGVITFYIKRVEGGAMSNYWFNQARVNDLLMLEGPLGSFFMRNTIKKNIIFFATGTGIAPIKAILEDINDRYVEFKDKEFWLFIGMRYSKDLLWNPRLEKFNFNLNYIPVVSRPDNDWIGETGYVQDAFFNHQVDLRNSQVYACGSQLMINSAKKKLIDNNLEKEHFFSDAFVASN